MTLSEITQKEEEQGANAPSRSLCFVLYMHFPGLPTACPREPAPLRGALHLSQNHHFSFSHPLCLEPVEIHSGRLLPTSHLMYKNAQHSSYIFKKYMVHIPVRCSAYASYTWKSVWSRAGWFTLQAFSSSLVKLESLICMVVRMSGELASVEGWDCERLPAKVGSLPDLPPQ